MIVFLGVGEGVMGFTFCHTPFLLTSRLLDLILGVLVVARIGSLGVVVGRTILDLLVISGVFMASCLACSDFIIFFACSVDPFLACCLAKACSCACIVSLLHADKSHAGLTIDSPPAVLRSLETPRLTFFTKLACWISAFDACIILGFVCFENVLIIEDFTHGSSSNFFHVKRAIFVGFPPLSATQSESDTALFAPDLSIFFSSESEKVFHHWVSLFI